LNFEDFTSLHPHQLISQLQVVVEVVFGSSRVADVTCVRDGGLDDATGIANSLHADNKVGQIIEGVKHSEHIHAILDGQVAKPTTMRVSASCVSKPDFMLEVS